jgi:hypothetical protein
MNQEYSQDLQNSKKLNTINVDMDYHPLTSSIYPANWLDRASEFEKHKMGEFNKLNEDSCFNQRKDNDNDKKLKYMTWNGLDLLESKDKLNFFGIGIRDGLNVPGERIDNYSDLLNGKTGGQLTNEKWKHSHGQLPLPTAPYRGQLHHGDVIKEDSIRNYIEVKKNSCLPKGVDFEQRSFAIFDDAQGIELPNANRSVEQKDNGFNLGRNGVPSRFQNRFETQQKMKSIGNLNVQPYNHSQY